MNRLEEARKTWNNKSDEWIYERLDNELKDKVTEIHCLLEELKQVKNNVVLGGVISRFLFDQSDELKMQCNEISVSIDPCYEDDKYIDLVIYNDNWNELKRIKTLNGL